MDTHPQDDIAPAPAENPEQDTHRAEPAAAAPGRMVAMPAFDPADAVANGTDAHANGSASASPADLRAARQALTGRAAIAASRASLTPAQLTWRKLRKNKLAVAGGIILIILYAVALLAQFLAPYDYKTQDAAATFRPPMAVHWTPAPVVYPVVQGFNEFRERTYVEDKTQPHKLTFFERGPGI